MSRSKVSKSVSFRHTEKETSPKHVKDFIPPVLKTHVFRLPVHLPVLAYSYFNWLDITQNVADQLLKSFYLISGAQFLYCMLLLKICPKKKGRSNILTVLGVYIASLLAAFPIFIMIILLGAPITVLLEETFLLSCHVSLIVVAPILTIYPFNETLFQFATAQVGNLTDHPYYTVSLGAVIGTWLGAIPIPLDWDRPWQQWPITLVVGCYMGASVGAIIGMYLNSLKRKCE